MVAKALAMVMIFARHGKYFNKRYWWCVRIAFFPDLYCTPKDWKEIIEGIAFGLVRPEAEGSGYFCEEFIVGR